MSLDSSILVQAVKQAAVDAVRAEAPMGVCYGTVTGTRPLQITVTPKLVLQAGQLILTSSVQDFTVSMTVDHTTEPVRHGHPVQDTYTGGGSAAPVEHSHPVRGKKSFRVHNALQMGEKVLLLRCDGGQQYIVLDRLEART